MTNQTCNTSQFQREGGCQVPSAKSVMGDVMREYMLMTGQATHDDRRKDAVDADAKPGKPVGSALATVQEAFGTAAEVLIVERDELKIPGPLSKAWEQFQSVRAGHGVLHRLVAVRCDKGLVALVFASAAVLEEFGSRNPWAWQGLATVCLGRPTVWFQCAGHVPENQGLIGIDVISSGDVPVAGTNAEPDEVLVRAGAIPAVDFQRINLDEK